jgi:hypothetical protein
MLWDFNQELQKAVKDVHVASTAAGRVLYFVAQWDAGCESGCPGQGHDRELLAWAPCCSKVCLQVPGH